MSVAADLFAGLTLTDPAIRPLWPFTRQPRLVGNAITARCEGTDHDAVHLAVAEASDAIIVGAGGRPDPAVIGELFGGAVRDSGRLMRWADFDLFTCSVIPRRKVEARLEAARPVGRQRRAARWKAIRTTRRACRASYG